MLKTFIAGIIAAALVFQINGCSTHNKTVQIGVLLPLTGFQADFGEMEKNSYEMLRELVNHNGGIDGKQLDFIYEDDTGKPEVGRASAERLININKVPLITGGYSSSVTFSACAVAQQYEIPFLVNTGSVDKITQPEAFNLKPNDGDKFYIYRLCPTVSEYASTIGSFLSEVVKPASVYILHENTAFGTEGAASFKSMSEILGIKVLGLKSYSAGTANFKPLLQIAKKAKPDIVYMVSYVMDAALLMKQSREIDFMPKLFFGAGGGFTMPAFKDNAGTACNMLVSTSLWHQSLPIQGAEEYYNEYVKKYGGDGPDYHGAEAYASGQVVVDALKRCDGNFTPAKIKSALDSTDLMTVFGPVRFTSYDHMMHQNKTSTYVVQWISEKLKLIWPKNIANADFQYPINWRATWQ